MGVAYYIVLVLENDVDGLDIKLAGKSLSRHIKSLDKAASDLGVMALSDFFSVPPEELAGFMSARDYNDLPPLQQFSALDGLATVRALLKHPVAKPALDDLKNCERILTAAARHDVRWHFQIDI